MRMTRRQVGAVALSVFALSAMADYQAVTGTVRVVSGQVKVVDGGPRYSYYRFSVKDIYNCDSGFELSELALYDVSGNRVNQGLTSSKNSASDFIASTWNDDGS